MKLFSSNKWTKWKPITIYFYEYQDRLILGRLNIKTGDVQFKSVKFHGKKQYHQAWNLFDKPFDANKQLLELLKPSDDGK